MTEITPAPGGIPYRRGVGLMLFNSSGLVFIGERQDTPGAWQMPQGGINRGEDPRVAALRELEEEIGTARARIIAESAKLHRYEFPDFLSRGRAPFKGKYRGQEQNWFALLFEGKDSDIRLDHHAEVEFADWRWVDMRELPSLIVPFKSDTYQALVAEFGHLPDLIRRGEAKPLPAAATSR